MNRNGTSTFARRTTATAAALVVAGSLALAATPSASAATAGTSTTCSTGSLPSLVQGRPASFAAGLPAGYWIWHDAYGWHLRVTHQGTALRVFSGSITATNPITAVKVRDESRDRVARSADGRTVSFRLTNHGGVDGLDFGTGCSKDVTFSLLSGGVRIDPARIHLGAHDGHPTSARFTISRTTA